MITMVRSVFVDSFFSIFVEVRVATISGVKKGVIQGFVNRSIMGR